MRTGKILSCLGLLVALTGCGDPALSLHPLYTEETTVFEPALLGTWGASDGDMVTFEKSGAQEYRLLYYAGGDLSIYEAHLLQLGSSLFLDVAPEDAAFEQLVENQSYTHQLVTVHTFHRIRLEGDKLDSAYFNAFWLRDKIEAKEISLTLSNPGSGGYLLTASTEELQELVAQYADEPGAFEPLDEFHRLPDEAGKVKQNPGDKEEP